MYKEKSFPFIVIPDCPSWCVLVHFTVDILFHSSAAK